MHPWHDTPAHAEDDRSLILYARQEQHFRAAG
jgi:hypothetical protein